MDRKLQRDIKHLKRFTKNIILKGMSIILMYNYFCINDSFIDQKKILLWVHTQQLRTLHMQTLHEGI